MEVLVTDHVRSDFQFMKRSTLAIFVSVGAALLAVAVGLPHKRLKELFVGEQHDLTALTPAGDIEHHNAAPKQSIVLAHVTGQDGSNYANAFRESRNYLDFARATIEAARSGNSDAQYYLGKALRLCNGSRAIFRFGSREIGLDEALSHYSSGRNSEKKIRAIYERCHDLEAVSDRAKLFGNPDSWIKSAADQGQPVAESDEALKGFSAMQRSAMTGAGDFSALTKSGADPRSLLLAAVQTKDPEALFNVGQAQGYLNNFHEDATKNELAWWLVACQRGLPCGSNSEFQDDVALNDGLLEDLSGPDLICAMAGKNCQEVERRAQEINEELNAGAWDQLGLQSRQVPQEAVDKLLSGTIRSSTLLPC